MADVMGTMVNGGVSKIDYELFIRRDRMTDEPHFVQQGENEVPFGNGGEKT